MTQFSFPAMPTEREGISAYSPLQVGSACDKEEKGPQGVSDQSLEEKKKVCG